jgi:hypothetical protein
MGEWEETRGLRTRLSQNGPNAPLAERHLKVNFAENRACGEVTIGRLFSKISSGELLNSRPDQIFGLLSQCKNIP